MPVSLDSWGRLYVLDLGCSSKFEFLGALVSLASSGCPVSLDSKLRSSGKSVFERSPVSFISWGLLYAGVVEVCP